MSARDVLFINMGDHLTTDEASQLIDTFAHELAEQIREATFPDDDHMEYFYTGVNCSADLIDPEVEK